MLPRPYIVVVNLKKKDYKIIITYALDIYINLTDTTYI